MTVPLEQSAGRAWLTIGCTLAIVCGVMLPIAVLDLRDAQLPQGWQTTPGVIEASGIRKTSSTSGRLGVDDFYAPEVGFRYVVADREWRGGTVSRGKGPTSESAARTIAGRYPIGARVPVFYDAKDPAQSVLEIEVPPKNYHAVMAMSGGVLISILSLLRFRHLRRRELGSVAAPGRNRQWRRKQRRQQRLARD